MNKKLLSIIGLGTLGSLGVAGVTIGAIALEKSDSNDSKINSLSNKVSNNLTSINQIIEELSYSYGNQSDAIEAQDEEITSIWDTIAENLQNLLTQIESQGNIFIDLYKTDLTTELQKVYDAIHNQQNLTDQNFITVNSALSSLVEKTNSLEAMQNALNDKVTQAEAESSNSIAELWAAHNSLTTFVNDLSSKTTLNTQDITALNSNVSILQDKVLKIDSLTQTLNSVKDDITSILNRLNDLESRVAGINNYDDTELKARISALEAAKTAIEARIDAIDAKADIVDQKFVLLDERISTLEIKVQLGQNQMTELGGYVNELKTLLTDIQSVQGQTATELAGFRQEFANINTKLDTLFENNASLQQLQTDVNYLYDQNLNLFNHFIDLQNQINNINLENYYRNTVIAIESNKTLYDYKSKKFTSQSIEIPNVLLAKNISLFIKIQTKDNNSSYITKVIDAYPEETNTFLGYAQSTTKENYLVGANISENTINVNRMWSKFSSSSSWKDMSDDETSTITLVKAIVTY